MQLRDSPPLDLFPFFLSLDAMRNQKLGQVWHAFHGAVLEGHAAVRAARAAGDAVARGPVEERALLAGNAGRPHGGIVGLPVARAAPRVVALARSPRLAVNLAVVAAKRLAALAASRPVSVARQMRRAVLHAGPIQQVPPFKKKRKIKAGNRERWGNGMLPDGPIPPFFMMSAVFFFFFKEIKR